MKNPNWDPKEAQRVFGKSPCYACPYENECAALGLELTCESFALAEKLALERLLLELDITTE